MGAEIEPRRIDYVVGEADGRRCARADDKMASEYNLDGGATLHLVLALRGGC